MPAIDSIFFDVDGTLVDASKDITNAMNHALAALGFGLRSQAEITSYVGNGVKDLVRKCLGSPQDGAVVDKAAELYWHYFMAHAVDETILYPNVREVLEYFRRKRKFILTNRYKDFAEATLKGLGIMDYFEEIIAGDDENCIKPSACIIDRVAPKISIDKKKALIVGDMAVDIMTGKNVGIKTCWVSYGLGRVDEIRSLSPDYIIDDIIGLKEIVE